MRVLQGLRARSRIGRFSLFAPERSDTRCDSANFRAFGSRTLSMSRETYILVYSFRVRGRVCKPET